MMNNALCLVCGQPLDVHRLQFWGGVAHAVAPNGRLCSRDDGERVGYIERIRMLQTIIRSLRWRAGRLRTSNARWDYENLYAYSDHWQQRLDRYLAILDEYYPRKVRP